MISAFVMRVRLLTYIMMLIVCLISNNACSDIRMDEHLDDLLTGVFLHSIEEKTKLVLAFPVEGKVSSLFGMRSDPFHKAASFHRGIDIAYHEGSPVLASGKGLVTYTGRLGGCGKTCILDHGNGLSTRYCHLHEIKVGRGEEVACGQEIGRMGSTGRATGPHLHFEVRLYGTAVDPAEYLVF